MCRFAETGEESGTLRQMRKNPVASCNKMHIDLMAGRGIILITKKRKRLKNRRRPL